MKPGIASIPCRSITRVLGPIHARDWASVPRAVMRSPRIAMACAVGVAVLIVTTLPLRSTRSAGCANAADASAAAAAKVKKRINQDIIPGDRALDPEFLADVLHGDSLGVASRCRHHALDRLGVPLAAEQ